MAPATPMATERQAETGGPEMHPTRLGAGANLPERNPLVILGLPNIRSA